MTELANACYDGDVLKVEHLLANGATDWNSGFINACNGGHLQVVKLMISKGANDWNWGLINACLCGHLQIIELLIANGADDWCDGLAFACIGKHMKIIVMMLLRGATNYEDIDTHKIDHKMLVYDYELPLGVLQKISNTIYDEIQKELHTHRQLYNSFFIIDFAQMLQGYIVS